MKNILIIKFGALRDVIRTSFILEGLHEKYQQPKIYWLTSDTSFDLLRFNPYIEHLITPTFNLELIYKETFDLVISMDDEIEVLMWLKDIKHRDLIGAYLDNDVAVYDERSSLWFDMGLLSRFGKEKADQLKKENHLTHRQMMEKIFGIKIKRPMFFNSYIIENSTKYLFEPVFFNIGINSGAGGRWHSKEMRIKETIRLINMLLSFRICNKPIRVFLLGGSSEISRHNEIKKAINSPFLSDTGNSNSLLSFAAIIKHLDYVVSSDSLALHLAIAQDVPHLGFFAPTSAVEIDTFGRGVKLISTSDDYCSYRKDADNSTITAERVFQCMKGNIKDLQSHPLITDFRYEHIKDDVRVL